MPSNFLVCSVLCAAALFILAAPMPPKVRWLIAAALFYASIVYFADAVGWITTVEQKQTLVRFAWLVLSGVIVACVVAWRLGGPRVWRAH